VANALVRALSKLVSGPVRKGDVHSAPRKTMKYKLISVLMCLSAQAAIVPSVGLEELIDRSEAIVHGRVMRSWSAWDNAHKYIWTHHLIAVTDPIRGAAGGFVVASEPGGELDGVAMRFSGSLEYADGEEAIVFLYRTPIGYLRATGAGQGKYTVSGLRVRANLKGIDLLNQRPLRGASLSTLDGATIADFKARVREAIRSGK
jgi:hypothetical protein